MIPKRIIYVWFGGNNYPSEFMRFKNTWKLNNPDYEILEINETNFNVNINRFTSEAYKANKLAFVSDYARIWAINKYGGIYLDTDVEVIKNFDFLLREKQFWAEEDIAAINSGLIFGSEKNNIVLKKILNRYDEINFSKVNSLKSITTVKIVSKILSDYGLDYTKKIQKLQNGIIIYPPSFFAPLHYWGGGKVKDNTVSIHHYKSSWTDTSKNLLKYFGHQVLFSSTFLTRIVRKYIK